MSATIAQFIAARDDRDLRVRLVAAGEQLGYSPTQTTARIADIVSKATDAAGGQTLAQVHAYAVSQYAPPPPPGADPTIITDDMIRAAVQTTLNHT